LSFEVNFDQIEYTFLGKSDLPNTSWNLR